VKPYFTEYSVKVTAEGLNPFRMIQGYHISDYSKELKSHIEKNYPDDLADFYNEKHHLYDGVMFGVDGTQGVRKLYLENDGWLKSIECQGSRRKYKIYREEFSPRLYRSWELDRDYNKVIRTLTTSFSLFKPMHTQADMLIRMCKKYARAHLEDFKQWLDSELKSSINWFGVSNNSFTIYYG